MRTLSRRISRVSGRLAPASDPAFLTYARAVSAWGGGEPDEAAAVRFARDLAGTRGGATWEGLVELAGGSNGGSARTSAVTRARDGHGHRPRPSRSLTFVVRCVQ